MDRINIFNIMDVDANNNFISTSQGTYSHKELPGYCPVCPDDAEKMKVVLSGQTEVFFCPKHRITLPIPL